MTNSRLTDEELDTLGALRRVGEPDGAVTEADGRYFYQGAAPGHPTRFKDDHPEIAGRSLVEPLTPGLGSR